MLPNRLVVASFKCSPTFTNGELWGVTTEFFAHHQGQLIISTVNVENIYRRVLNNYCEVAHDVFGIEPPYRIALGAVGLDGAVLGINRHDTSDLIHQHQLSLRRVLNDVSLDARDKLLDEFLDRLFDLAGGADVTRRIG
jgi:hypothetical protein